jgi:hypothetical protein
MRPKIVILILLAALAGVTGILLIKHQGAPPPAAAPIAITETKAAAPQTARTITSVPPTAPAPVAAAPVATNTLTPEQRQAAIDAETDHLQQWSMNDDPASLSNILADLTSPEKEVRQAAIEAAEQFGGTNAIPILKNLAANDEDPKEKAALLEAAHFLSLPSIFDVDNSTTPAERDARRPAQMQKRAPNQNSSAAPNN